MNYQVDVAVIGAGPAGALMAGVLAARGLEVLVVESAQFPRFSIGESLLPQVTACLEEADMLRPVEAAGFQHKDGALFACDGRRECFVFADKSANGPNYAWEVKRADFDDILARQAEARGARIHYRARVTAWRREPRQVTLACEDESGPFSVSCRFVVDASGFGRVLARLADLESPSELPPRRAIFCHLRHRPLGDDFDRNKITIAQARMELPYWFWLIPFADGTASFGLVGGDGIGGNGSLDDALDTHLATVPLLADWLSGAERLMPPRTIAGYACNVDRLSGERFVLLGNAGEFIDPIFSSGVSIACRSALMAAPLVERTVRGEPVDWLEEFERPLRRGIHVFRVFVEAWYEGTLPRLIYASRKSELHRRHICSILAGYVWDRNNPFTRTSATALRRLASIVDD